ncbi:hypothetical protein GCM10010530_31500 [Kribbella aluminosa]
MAVPDGRYGARDTADDRAVRVRPETLRRRHGKRGNQGLRPEVGEMAAVVGIDQAAYAIHDALADTYFVRDLYDALQR